MCKTDRFPSVVSVNQKSASGLMKQLAPVMWAIFKFWICTDIRVAEKQPIRDYVKIHVPDTGIPTSQSLDLLGVLRGSAYLCVYSGATGSIVSILEIYICFQKCICWNYLHLTFFLCHKTTHNKPGLVHCNHKVDGGEER